MKFVLIPKNPTNPFTEKRKYVIALAHNFDAIYSIGMMASTLKIGCEELKGNIIKHNGEIYIGEKDDDFFGRIFFNNELDGKRCINEFLEPMLITSKLLNNN